MKACMWPQPRLPSMTYVPSGRQSVRLVARLLTQLTLSRVKGRLAVVDEAGGQDGGDFAEAMTVVALGNDLIGIGQGKDDGKVAHLNRVEVVVHLAGGKLNRLDPATQPGSRVQRDFAGQHSPGSYLGICQKFTARGLARLSRAVRGASSGLWQIIDGYYGSRKRRSARYDLTPTPLHGDGEGSSAVGRLSSTWFAASVPA